ncbi:MAG: hypothetical protein ACREM8_04875, partial [Vulcanimicrobiaceae bacterium]
LRERANDRRLRVAAPEWCVIDDLPPVGARLARGAPLARLGVMGSDRVLHSPIDGTVAAVHAENGYDRRAGEPLVDLLAGA